MLIWPHLRRYKQEEEATMELQATNIYEALARIAPLVHRTPLQRCRTVSEMVGKNVFFKLENLQKTGSFKIRGAANKIFSLSPEEAARGVISASAGNHAQGVAWAAQASGIPAIVVMPRQAPLAKVRATEAYGAQVVLHGDNYDEAYQWAEQLRTERGMTFVHAFDDEAVMAGQGTIALEIIQRLAYVDTLIAPVGGGGLLAGLAVAAKAHNPQIKVIGVQAAGAPSMAVSLQQGSVQCLAGVTTMADGIAVKQPGARTFQYVRQYADEVVLVSENELQEAILFMLERGKMMTEGAGVAGVAALLAGKINTGGQNLAVVISGGNLDATRLSACIAAKYGTDAASKVS